MQGIEKCMISEFFYRAGRAKTLSRIHAELKKDEPKPHLSFVL